MRNFEKSKKLDNVCYDINIEDEQLLDSLKDFNINELDDSYWLEIARNLLSKNELSLYRGLKIYRDNDKRKPFYWLSNNKDNSLIDSGLFEKVEDKEECVRILVELAREEYELAKSKLLFNIKSKKEDSVKEKGKNND